MQLLEVQKIREGLWRWTSLHPEWKPDKGGPGGWEQSVGCVYYETAGAVILINPLAPPVGTPEAEKFWKHLDADVERAGSHVVVLVSNRYHGRSAAAVHARYGKTSGCEIWAHEGAKGHLTIPVDHWFREGGACRRECGRSR